MKKLHSNIKKDKDKKINELYYNLTDDQKEDILQRDDEDNDREYHEKYTEKLEKMSTKKINNLHKIFFGDE